MSITTSGRPLKKLRFEFALRSEPVVEVAAMLAAACEKELVGTPGDFLTRDDDRGLGAATSAGWTGWSGVRCSHYDTSLLREGEIVPQASFLTTRY
jgi:hypothetical protein